MLEQVVVIFENMTKKVKKLKKSTYEANTKMFKEEHGHFIDEMMQYMDAAEDKKKAAQELSECFVKQVQERFEVRGKISSVTQLDLNLFMIYYVFPTILSTYHDDAKLLADTLCDTWNNCFKKTKMGYTDYETLYKSFREKIFGIF